MDEAEKQIWELVHNWCNQQSCEIPDFNKRVLMERILALRQPLAINSVCTCTNAQLEKDSLVPVYCYNCNAYVQTDL